jgi:hypothetical protein
LFFINVLSFGRKILCLVVFFTFIGIVSGFARGNAQKKNPELAVEAPPRENGKAAAEQGPGNPVNPQSLVPERPERNRAVSSGSGSFQGGRFST